MEPDKSRNWWIRSKKAPRWNAQGLSGDVSCYVLPQECKKKIDELTLRFGRPPDDLEWSYAEMPRAVYYYRKN